MLDAYLKHKAEREALGIPPKPLTEQQVRELTELLRNPAGQDKALLIELITHRVPAGVDEAAEVKAAFLYDIAKNKIQSPLISPQKAIFLLSTMGGGFNIAPLIDLLDHPDLSADAADALSKSILIFDAFDDMFEKSKTNSFAQQVVQAWADAKWFTEKESMPEKMTLTVFKVDGEINTDDFSPASEAWSRPDIPLHALSMLASRTSGDTIKTISELKEKGFPIAFVGDVVGTGSSRKSAANSVIWHIGEDIPFIPNKRRGGVVLGATIAPIFFNSLEDAGALPIECDVSKIKHGNTITIFPYENRIIHADSGEELANFKLKTNVISDEVRAGGRIPLIIGRTLTQRARQSLDLPSSDVFETPPACKTESPGYTGYTLAQKMVGQACGCAGILPGEYCEPEMTTVGSQDTTGPMTRDEIKELACLKFSADLVMQSFCHTAAYPKAVDIEMQNSLQDFIKARGGVALLPGDGIIHSWLNRMLLPDTVGTGGDSHTRFPIGISFPAGSGLIAFAAAPGIYAAGHAGIGTGKIYRQPPTRHYHAGCGQCGPLCGHCPGPVDRKKRRQEKHICWTHY